MSLKKANELRQKRAELVAQARAHLDASESRAANGVVAVADLEQYNRMEADIKTLGSQIEINERQANLDREIAASVEQEEKNSRKATTKEEKESAAVRKFFLTGEKSAEMRNLQSDDNLAGGYTVMPEAFSSTLIKFVDNLVFLRGLATVEKLVKAASLGVPSLDNDPDDGEWTSELSTGSDDTTMSFGKRVLVPHPLVKRIKVSMNLLRNSSRDISSLVAQRLAYKLAITHEKGFMTGNGAAQPLGLFTASANGIPTSRDYSTGNDATSIKFDGLIGCMYNVKSQYQKSGSWILHRDAVSQIRKLKDGNGQYLWQPSVQMGQPDMILGRPVYMSEYAPNTFTTGLYVGMFGDYKNYMVVDSLEIAIQVLNELYAETNRVGMIARSETDGMPVLAEAFSRLKLA